LILSVDARARASDLYIQRRVGKTTGKGQLSNYEKRKRKTTEKNGIKTKESRPVVSTRKSFSNTPPLPMRSQMRKKEREV
jgi:hypothetical protein